MLNINFTPFPILTTERLTLRQLVLNDDMEIFSLRSDSEINKYLDRQNANTIDDARIFINRVNENIDKHNSIYWAITVSNENSLVGTICLFNLSADNDSCEIGYELLTEFWGKGIMKEAVEKIIAYAFDTIKVQKIEAFLHRDNMRSIKLLKKLLFKTSNETDTPGSDLVYYYLSDSSEDYG